VAGVLAVNAAVGSAAAQDESWSPAPAPAEPPAPPPEEGGGVGLQLLAGLGIGAVAVASMWGTYEADQTLGEVPIYGLAAITPAATGLAICNLGQRSGRSEPSCPRAIVAAYIGSLVAIPVFLFTLLAFLDWGPEPDRSKEDRAEIVITAATAVAWVGGMTAGAMIFGRRRVWRPVVGAAPPAPRAAWSFTLSDDPRQPRWAGARASGQLVFPLLSVAF